MPPSFARPPLAAINSLKKLDRRRQAEGLPDNNVPKPELGNEQEGETFRNSGRDADASRFYELWRRSHCRTISANLARSSICCKFR
jgi:hypothetical protein